MKYKVHITVDDGELLNTYEIDTSKKNWSSFLTRNILVEEVFDEIKRDIERGRLNKWQL